MKYLPSIDLWSRSGISLDEVIQRLSERTDDECYTAYHFIENMGAKEGMLRVVPIMDHRDSNWLIAAEPSFVMSKMKWPDGTTDLIKEITALCAEYSFRDLNRRALEASK